MSASKEEMTSIHDKPRTLAVGHRVRFNGGGMDISGTVIEANWCSVRVEWDDGEIGLYDHQDDMIEVRDAD